MSNRVQFQYRTSAFRRRLQTFAIENCDHIDIHDFLSEAFQYFKDEIEKILRKYSLIKVNTTFKVIFIKLVITPDGETTEQQTIYIHTKISKVNRQTDLSIYYNTNIVTFISEKVEEFQMRGSGFTLSKICELLVNVNQHQPITGSSFIELPEYLKKKHAIVNVVNDDEQCFKYALLSALYPIKSNPHRVTNYKKYSKNLNFNGIQFPVDIKQIMKFEKQNTSISINVYGFNGKENKITVLHLTESVKQNHIHLLLITKDNKNHYCWIKHLSRLLSSQTSSNGHRKYFCDRCLNYFMKKEYLSSHRVICTELNDCAIEMPTCENNKIKFDNFKHQLKVPFVIYADIEAILETPSEKFCENDTTKAYQQHVAHSIGYYFQCLHDTSKSYYKSRRGIDCIKWFVQELHSIAFIVKSMFDNPIPLQTTIEDEIFFDIANKCHICGVYYNENDVPVRDHCHLSGRYRDSAHSNCNLNYKESRSIPVIFHNLSHYDSHFLMIELASSFTGNISIIPINNQNYISFTKTVSDTSSSDYLTAIKLRFIDSFRFMTSSLDELSSFLPSEKKKILHSECQKSGMNMQQIKMLERKGIFCYDYVSSWNKLDETCLPSKSEFYSKLTECEISDDNYQFATDIWQIFRIKTLGEYSDLYLKTDILLLADVFENFRENCYDIYNLDPAHYYTAPGLSFDAMLKYTNIEIELLTDIDMLMFIERGIKGGISQCSKRYSKANNKYMEEYDPEKETKYLTYVDANNLYGYSLAQHLPLNNFKWINIDEFNKDTILGIAYDSSIGYIFEVDLEYPQYLHDDHKDYPLCAENSIIPGTKNETKLLLTLYDKKNYVIHYKMLQFVLQHGLILKTIHRAIQFNQSKWMKSYIDLNTELRMKATNNFEKNFYKLLSNAIYGKTMENIRSREDIRLKTYWDGRYGARKLIAQPNFKRFTIFDENLVAIHMEKTNILMNKPIIIGMSVLDLSKVVMYDFHYNYMKPKYGNNVQLMYTGIILVFHYSLLNWKNKCFYSPKQIQIVSYMK